ncbi:hypothetical protein BJ742DRAFT_836202 [Cladochytrium replicatum]|nr:hypothetical protein BJ742DRAFT_836202 [Cladochytrium replicatum]
MMNGHMARESRFITNTHLIATRIFTQSLSDNECLHMIGLQRYSHYAGYGHTFEWAGLHHDSPHLKTTAPETFLSNLIPLSWT